MLHKFKAFKFLGRVGVAGLFAGTAGYVASSQYSDTDLSTIGAVRLSRVAFAATRVILDYKYNLSSLEQGTPEYANTLSIIHQRSAERLRDVCCANGGCFIKIGQHVGALVYLLPHEYVNTMKILHSDAPKSPIKDIKKVVCQDLNVSKLEEVFINFETEPVGAASLAQVHRAQLLDGTDVAVKVQHPNVAEHSKHDLNTLDFFGRLVLKLFPDFKFFWLVEEAKVNLPRELDFIQEGENAEETAAQYAHLSFVHVPKIYWNWSTKRVLTMEFCQGETLDSGESVRKMGLDPINVSEKLGELYSNMIFEQGRVHCDPHPGNLLLQKDFSGKPRIVLLDHGLYTRLTDKFRLNYCRLWQSLIGGDLEGIRRYAGELGCAHLHGLFACMVTGRSWAAITSGIQKKKYSAKEELDIQQNAALYVPQITDVLNSVPREMLLILKTNDLLRGLEHRLGTRARATAFLSMSRCCVRSLTEFKLQELDKDFQSTAVHKLFFQKLFVRLDLQVQLLRLFIFEFYLWSKSYFIPG